MQKSRTSNHQIESNVLAAMRSLEKIHQAPRALFGSGYAGLALELSNSVEVE